MAIGTGVGASSGACELTVLMPCLDEERTVGACVERARTTLERLGIEGEVLIADNGSRDRSRELAESAGARVVSVVERGYGAALSRGIEAARGRYVVMGDCDGSYDFGELAGILAELRAGRDLVLGNRFRGGIHPGAMPTTHRYLGNPALTAIARLFFRSPSGDIYCGLRGFRRDAILALELETSGMEFALEMVVKASMSSLSIAEVPVTLSPDGRNRPPHLRTWRDGWRSLRFLLSFSPSWMFLYPGLVLTFSGLVIGLWILPGARHVGLAELDVHTLMYCGVALCVGVQLIVFALLAKALSIALGFHPHDARFERLLARLHPTLGALGGLLLIGLGVALGVRATSSWALEGFGQLDPFRTMRLVIPSAIALTVGCQLLFASFFLSLLSIRRRARPPGVRA